jgi:O-antigen/teichoic acid export membrane protein
MTSRGMEAAAPATEVRRDRVWTGVRRRAGGFVWLFAGRLVLMGANAATMLLLAHHLALPAYGLFVAAVGAQLLLSRMILLGLDGSVLRLRTLPELRDRSDEVVRAGLVILRVTAGIVIVGALVASLAAWIAAPRWPVWALAAVAAGAIGVALVDYGCCDRLARLEYLTAALLLGGTAVLRLIVTSFVLVLAPDSPALVFLAYAGASLLVGLALAVALTRARISEKGKAVRPEGALVQRLFRYSLWKAGVDVGTILVLNQGVFLLTLLGQRAEAGLFGLGLVLSQGFFAVNLAFFDYLMSRMMRVGGPDKLPWFLVRAFGATFAVVAACVPVTIGIRLLLPYLLRPELHAVVPIFYFLSAAMLLRIVQCPLLVTCYYLVRPHVALGCLAMEVGVTGVLGIALAPRWGAEGAAVAQFLGAASGAAALSVWVMVTLRSVRRSVRPREAADGV